LSLNPRSPLHPLRRINPTYKRVIENFNKKKWVYKKLKKEEKRLNAISADVSMPYSRYFHREYLHPVKVEEYVLRK